MNKRVLIMGVILIAGSLIIAPWKIETSRMFSWQQELADPHGLEGWKLYRSSTPGGPYTLMDTIPFTISQPEYTAIVHISDPGYRVSALYFVMTAFDRAGNESSYSNEVSMSLDGQAQGMMGYDFIWSGKQLMTVNYGRVFLQIIGIIIGAMVVSIEGTLVLKQLTDCQRRWDSNVTPRCQVYTLHRLEFVGLIGFIELLGLLESIEFVGFIEFILC